MVSRGWEVQETGAIKLVHRHHVRTTAGSVARKEGKARRFYHKLCPKHSEDCN